MPIPHAVPDRVVLVSGTGRGQTELTAFDRALHDAGIHNANIVQVSSVIPPGADVETTSDRNAVERDVEIGGVHPMVVAKASAGATDYEAGTPISAAIGAGMLTAGYGVNVETAAVGRTPDELRAESDLMLAELADIRETSLESTTTVTATDTVPDSRAIAAVAAAVYF